MFSMKKEIKVRGLSLPEKKVKLKNKKEIKKNK